MDGSAFRNMNLGALFSWPMLAIFGIGCLTLIGSAIGLLVWLILHLQWV